MMYRFRRSPILERRGAQGVVSLGEQLGLKAALSPWKRWNRLTRRPLVRRRVGRRLLWSIAEERREHLSLERRRSGAPYLWIHMRGTGRWFKETEIMEDDDG